MSARVANLPVDPQARNERLLRNAWAEEDDLAARLKVAQARSRKLEREVAEDRGYGHFISRENLQRALDK